LLTTLQDQKVSFGLRHKLKNETLGNLSHLPPALIDLVRRALRGETFVPVAERVEVLGSRPHGYVHAVRLAMQRLKIDALLGYSRDGKKNKLQVNYGLMTTREGCPISISVYEGNTSDATTLDHGVEERPDPQPHRGGRPATRALR
jgi:hypothetical protein